MPSLEEKMVTLKEKFRVHFELFEADSMTPEQFKEWNSVFVVSFFDYQAAKSAFVLGKIAINEAKNVIKK